MYRPVSAGHAAKETPRTIEQASIDELVGKAKAWLDQYGDYDDAFAMAEEIVTTPDVAGLLAIHPTLQQHERYSGLGHFISALWNQCRPEKIITYDHVTPEIDYLGYRLPAHKVLIVRGDAGSAVAMKAKGLVIIQGVAGIRSFAEARGTLIVQGKLQRELGYRIKGAVIALTPTSPGQDFWGKKITWQQYTRNAALKEYVDRLLGLAKDNPAAIETEFGNGIAITERINELTRRLH